jgi:hypothetical protein
MGGSVESGEKRERSFDVIRTDLRECRKGGLELMKGGEGVAQGDIQIQRRLGIR